MNKILIILLFFLNYSFSQSDYYTKGIKAQKDKNHEEAIKLFTEAISNNTDSTAVYYKRGVSYFELKQYDKAIEDFRTSIDKDVRKKGSYFFRGIIFESTNQLEKANSEYQKVLEIDNSFPYIYGMIAVNYFNLKDYKKSIEFFDQEILRDSLSALNYVRRGNSYDMIGDFEQALINYNKAILIDSSLSNAYYDRGIAYKNRKLYDEAIANITKAIELDTMNAMYYFNRAIAYANSNNSNNAINDLFQYLKFNSNKNGDLLSVYNYIKSLGYNNPESDHSIKDESETFSINLPESWHVKKTDDRKTSQLFVSVEKINNPSDKFTVGVTASYIRRMSKSFKNLKNDEQILNGWTNASISELKKSQVFEIISTSEWIIENYKGYLFDIKYQPAESDINLRMFKLILVYNDNLIDITFESPNNIYDKYRKTFYEAISSIDIL